MLVSVYRSALDLYGQFTLQQEKTQLSHNSSGARENQPQIVHLLSILNEIQTCHMLIMMIFIR